MKARLSLLALCLFAFTYVPQFKAQETNGSKNQSPFENALSRLEWRSIGPANMGGRVADVEGIPGDPNVVYVATASGGLWKTTNDGTSWVLNFCIKPVVHVPRQKLKTTGIAARGLSTRLYLERPSLLSPLLRQRQPLESLLCSRFVLGGCFHLYP